MEREQEIERLKQRQEQLREQLRAQNVDPVHLLFALAKVGQELDALEDRSVQTKVVRLWDRIFKSRQQPAAPLAAAGGGETAE